MARSAICVAGAFHAPHMCVYMCTLVALAWCVWCRELYLRLEATAALGPLPTSTPGLSVLITTGLDHRRYSFEQAMAARQGGGEGAGGGGAIVLDRSDPRAGGVQAMASIYRVLKAAGFSQHMLEGFGEVGAAGRRAAAAAVVGANYGG